MANHLFKEQPVNRAEAITKSDTVNIPGGVCDAIYCGTAGTVTVVFENDLTAQFTVAIGTILPVAAKRVDLTGSSATLLVAMYQARG